MPMIHGEKIQGLIWIRNWRHNIHRLRPLYRCSHLQKKGEGKGSLAGIFEQRVCYINKVKEKQRMYLGGNCFPAALKFMVVYLRGVHVASVGGQGMS